MKKFLLLILLFTLVLSLCFAGGTVASAEGESPYALARAFADAHPKRGVLSEGEVPAGNALKVALETMGYVVTEKELSYYDGTTEQKLYKSKNVIGTKDNGKEKTILIGGYYGGYSESDDDVGEGASVALTVGTLLYVAKALVSMECDYNVAVGFWGGMEFYRSFNVEKCGVPLDKIALYINLDCVGAGTYDYLYADDVPRSQESFFRKVISEQKAEIHSAPVYKRTTSLSGGGGAYSSSHLGLLGANRFFMDEEVPCVSFLSGAWDYDCGLYRYHEREYIEGTLRDTLEEIDRRNGGKDRTESRLLAVAGVVVKGVTSSKLRPALEEAAKETTGADLNSMLAYYLITILGSLFFAAIFIWLILKQGKDRTDRVWRNPAPSAQEGEDPYEEMRSEDADAESSEETKGEEEDDVFHF